MEKPIVKGKIDLSNLNGLSNLGKAVDYKVAYKSNNPNKTNDKNNIKSKDNNVLKKVKFFEQYKNEKLTFQLKSGTIVEGNVDKEVMGFVVIKNVVIIGKENIAKSDWLCVERTQISHFHPQAVINVKN